MKLKPTKKIEYVDLRAKVEEDTDARVDEYLAYVNEQDPAAKYDKSRLVNDMLIQFIEADKAFAKHLRAKTETWR